MDNVEIGSYINSASIRNYLKETGYNFTSLEAAWIVYQSESLVLSEKIKLWDQIISDMPDGKVESVHLKRPYDSLHEMLRGYMGLLEKEIGHFKDRNPYAVYQYCVECDEYSYKYSDFGMFSDYWKCFESMKTDVEECLKNGEVILSYRIKKTIMDSNDIFVAEYGKEYEIKWLEWKPEEKDYDLYYIFDNLWFAFPVPFEFGDVLYNPFHRLSAVNYGPVVVTGITPYMNFLTPKKKQKGGDITDMNVFGFFQEEGTGAIYHEVTWNYMEYEYFPREQMKGKRRILNALSMFLKKEISVDDFLSVFQIIIMEDKLMDLKRVDGIEGLLNKLNVAGEISNG